MRIGAASVGASRRSTHDSSRGALSAACNRKGTSPIVPPPSDAEVLSYAGLLGGPIIVEPTSIVDSQGQVCAAVFAPMMTRPMRPVEPPMSMVLLSRRNPSLVLMVPSMLRPMTMRPRTAPNFMRSRAKIVPRKSPLPPFTVVTVILLDLVDVGEALEATDVRVQLAAGEVVEEDADTDAGERG